MFDNIKKSMGIGKIIIYKAPIYRLFTDDVKLEKGVLVPEVKRELSSDDELFYISHRAFISMKHNYRLPDEEEANDIVLYAIEKYKNNIMDLIKIKKSIPEDREFRNYLKAISACLYLDESEIEKRGCLSKSEFIDLKKAYKKKK